MCNTKLCADIEFFKILSFMTHPIVYTVRRTVHIHKHYLMCTVQYILVQYYPSILICLTVHDDLQT